MNKMPIAACYCRLSNDDKEIGESASIENQRSLLNEYCISNGIPIADFYVDDGFTGTNFNRPDFIRMMNDINLGRANTIIVKDMSRFGREEAHVLTYVEKTLPEMGIDFIAISDQYNSRESKDFNVSGWMQLHIRALFNEYYPADTSYKVRKVHESKAKNGECIGGRTPYGYLKDPQDSHQIVVDPETAPIVVRIFEMAAYESCGFCRIANALSQMQIMNPSALYEQRANRPYDGDPYEWSYMSVRTILHNEVYIGTFVSGKRKKLNFKSSKILSMPKEDWIVIKNHHEAIISDQLWDEAHERLDSRKREPIKSDFVNIFAGLVKCEDCGHAMGITDSKSAEKNYLVCGIYRAKGKDSCDSHRINYNDLYEIVITDLRRIFNEVVTDKEQFRKMVVDAVKAERTADSPNLDKQIAELETDIAKANRRYDTLYDDRLNGVISAEKFIHLTERFDDDMAVKKKRLHELKQRSAEDERKYSDVDNFISVITEKEAFDRLDKETLNKLISKITIGKRIKDEDGRVRQRITIHYKFLGNLGTYEHTLD